MEPAGKNDKRAPTETLRTYKNGHQYYKSSDCPTCPTCEAERKPKDGFLAVLYAPARRALQQEGITTVERLSEFTEEEILKLHGIGKTALPKLRSALQGAGLKFRT